MSKIPKGIAVLFARELRRYMSRPLYWICLAGIPLFCYFFFSTLMWNGVPERLPIAVVDQDHSSVSRSLIRTVNAMSAVEVTQQLESYHAARQAMQRGEVYAFLVIPEGFQAKASSGKQPELAFFSNDAYFVAGLFSYKALKLSAALANGAVVKATLLAKGASEQAVAAQMQPVVLNTNPLGNPWISYSIFLCNILLPCLLEVMIFLMTVFAIGIEIKEGTSRRLLVTSNRSMLRLLLGKLLPQTVIYFVMGLILQFYLYGVLQFPHQTGILPMAAAMLLLVVASQAVGVFMIGVAGQLRLGLSFAGLVGVIAFSLVGFSLPVVSMYAPFHYLSPLLPVRHYFLIYADQALGGMPLWYSLRYYFFLVLYLLLPLTVIPRLRRAYYEQVYKP
jgi:ABC-2 type transport system permease protein